MIYIFVLTASLFPVFFVLFQSATAALSNGNGAALRDNNNMELARPNGNSNGAVANGGSADNDDADNDAKEEAKQPQPW